MHERLWFACARCLFERDEVGSQLGQVVRPHAVPVPVPGLVGRERADPDALHADLVVLHEGSVHVRAPVVRLHEHPRRAHRLVGAVSGLWVFHERIRDSLSALLGSNAR